MIRNSYSIRKWTRRQNSDAMLLWPISSVGKKGLRSEIWFFRSTELTYEAVERRGEVMVRRASGPGGD